MDIEKQVCSLKLAKRLEQLNCKQESLWYWGERDGRGWLFSREQLEENMNNGTFVSKCKFYSAFTVAELGEMLKDVQYELPIFGKNKKWGSALLGKWFDTEANARVKMLIYLLENNLTNK